MKGKIHAMTMILAISLICNIGHATLTNDTQLDLMFSARQADLAEYFKATGVVVQDTPLLNPFFAGLRVEQCAKRIWMFESTQVILPCFASMSDRISWQYYSHARQTQRGIAMYNKGDIQDGKALIESNTMEYIPLKTE